MDLRKRAWADISLDALAHNYHALRSLLPSKCKYLGVVKANAYGHGAVQVARELRELGADYLAVACIEEAMQLRRHGNDLPILILGVTPAEYAQVLAENNITQEVHSLTYAEALNEGLSGTGKRLRIHLKIDTGLTRIGFFSYGEAENYDELLLASRLGNLEVEGAFTHFAASDSLSPENVDFTRQQYARFVSITDKLQADGTKLAIRHCCNSGAAVQYPEFCLDMVRPGIATYGHFPSHEVEGGVQLQPMMSLHTVVGELRRIPAGSCISYGRSYTAKEPRTVAVLTIGYADGISRQLNGSLKFLIRGQTAPMLGKICMDVCMVDVTDIPGVKVGDMATLFGTDETGRVQPVETWSDQLQTIPYECLCAVSPRVTRRYIRGGQITEITSMLDL